MAGFAPAAPAGAGAGGRGGCSRARPGAAKRRFAAVHVRPRQSPPENRDRGAAPPWDPSALDLGGPRRPRLCQPPGRSPGGRRRGAFRGRSGPNPHRADRSATKARAATTARATKAPATAARVSDERPEDRPATGPRRWPRAVPPELLLLTFVAAVTRLVALGHPRAIVFDEIYFRDYSLRYQSGSYYFDLHPPLGKLLLAAWAKIAGVSAAPDSADPAVALRWAPAIAGTLLIAVFYLFLRRLTASRRVATLGAALLLLDNALLVESRFTLVDSFLLLFGLGALTCFLAARSRSGRAHWVLLAAAAVLAGMAVSTKWTGLTAIAVIAVTWAAQAVRERTPWRPALGQAGLLAVLPVLVYLTVFAVHFALLPNSGPGDAYMSRQFQSTLAGNAGYDPAAQMSLPAKIVETNKAIHSYEDSLNQSTHPYSSSWLSWPVLHRSVYYWTGPAANGEQDHIYLQGNPVVWWGILLGALVVAVGWLRRPQLFARHKWQLGFLGLAWAANFLPFATMERPMFLYHYLFALMFSLAAVTIGIGLLAGWMNDGEEGAGGRPAWRFGSRRSAVVYGGILAVAAAAFLSFAPLSYGTPLDDAGLNHRVWLESWR